MMAALPAGASRALARIGGSKDRRGWALGFGLWVVLSASCATGEVPAYSREEILRDWIEQDAGREATRCFTSEHNAALEQRIIEKALAEVCSPELEKQFDASVKAGAPGRDPRWKELYIRACEARRAARLANLLRQTRRIVFTKHYNLGGSHYAYTEGQSDAQMERHFVPGSALCLLTMKGSDGVVETLLQDPNGVIRDPNVSYDGKRILFAWKKSDREDDYHLYEMDLATRKIRQLTFGLGFADYEGAYLPNGDIVFSSTRCVQIVDCWFTEVSNLYTCDRNGKYLRRLGFDQVHTNYPQVLDDGRVIYTRWDYNDRGQVFPQPLFVMNIDGTAQTEYYGNNSWWPTTVAHARGIPGTGKVVAIATGHHSIQTGALIVIDVARGRQEAAGATLVAPRVEDKKDRRYNRIDGYTGHNGHFTHPYPLNEREYIASYSAHQIRGETKNGYALYYVRDDAARELLALDAEISCNQPVLLMERERPPVRASQVDYRKSTGAYYMQDIHEGPGLEDVPRGSIKKLRVVALEFRAAGTWAIHNRCFGPAGKSMVSTPISGPNGSWDVKKIVGEARVHPDGSAFFEAPARTPLYFQAIDENGYVAQTMRSWSTLMPGEIAACVGCHEDKNTVPLTVGRVMTQAGKAGPQKLDPFYGPPRGFSFREEIQPILDRHCIKCHNDRSMISKMRGPAESKKADAATGEKKAFSLLGEQGGGGGGRKWSDAYLTLTRHGTPNRIVNWLNAQSIPPMLPPYHAGSAKSDLMILLKAGHGNVKLSREELDKIACWIDLLVPYCGDYMEARAWPDKYVDQYRRFLGKRHRMENLELDNIEALILDRTGESFKFERRHEPVGEIQPAPAPVDPKPVEPKPVEPDAALPRVRITRLTPLHATTGYGVLGIGKAASGRPLSLSGKVYRDGIGVHANAKLVYACRPQWRRFVATVGIDDWQRTDPRASIVCHVIAEDAAGKKQTLAKSPTLQSGKQQQHDFDVSLPAGTARLHLVVDDAGDGIACDHADWVNAEFRTQKP